MEETPVYQELNAEGEVLQCRVYIGHRGALWPHVLASSPALDVLKYHFLILPVYLTHWVSLWKCCSFSLKAFSTPHMPSEVLLQNLLKPDNGLHSIQIIVFYIFWLFHYK